MRAPHDELTDQVAPGHCVIINMSSGGANRSHRRGTLDRGDDPQPGDRARALWVNALVPGLIATRPEHLEPAAKKRRHHAEIVSTPTGRGAVEVPRDRQHVSITLRRRAVRLG